MKTKALDWLSESELDRDRGEKMLWGENGESDLVLAEELRVLQLDQISPL